MKINNKGATRTVIIAFGYAFKIPKLYNWETFLWGLLANLNEQKFSTLKWEKLCPVVFSLPLGFLVVMPEAKMLTSWEYSQFSFNEFAWTEPYTYSIVENKQNSFGWLNDKIVAIDYGSPIDISSGRAISLEMDLSKKLLD